MDKLIYAQASPHSIGGNSLLLAKEIDESNVDKFTSTKTIVANAVKKLKKAGFQVLEISETSISICGPQSLYEKTFKTKLTEDKHEVLGSGGNTAIETFVNSVDETLPSLIATEKSELADVLEGVAVAIEPTYFANAFAPPKSYWHLRVPGDVSLGMNADKVHRLGNTGQKIRVTMVDSGWQKHPYFEQRGYNILPTILGPGATNAGIDENGHGTAESANIFAVAPDVQFRMVKMGSDAVGAFNAAVNARPRPHIISCSWGYSIPNGPLPAYLQTLAAAVSNAVHKGIIVIFSAGNGHFGFPGQHPDVISAGGVYKEITGANRASDYSSGFLSTIYRGRKVPDVSGLVGMRPKAAYIMLPLPDGCQIDVALAGGTHPNGDETTNRDGWAAISGTSAAAPQLAGICALMKRKKSTLTPVMAKKILMKTAVDVVQGSNFPQPRMNHPAIPGYDLATGSGLADAFKAVTNTI